jgi:TetR/AcrR family transcriptional regulator
LHGYQLVENEVVVGTKTSGMARKRPASRRIGGEKSKTRSLLLNAARRLMLKQGYAAVTSRKVAYEAKVTSQLVHYYFSSMDALFLALWRSFVSANMERQARALASPDVLGAIWNFTAGTALELEFIALARHRKIIRKEIAGDADRFRQMQIGALSRVIDDYGLGTDKGAAEALAVVLTSVSRSMVMEKALGVSVGLAPSVDYVEKWIGRLNAVRRRKSRSTRPG